MNPKQPTEAEKAAMNDLVEDILSKFINGNMGIIEVIKVNTAVIVKALSLVSSKLTQEEYDAIVDFYTNVSTSTVRYLSDGTMPDKNFTNKGNVQ